MSHDGLYVSVSVLTQFAIVVLVGLVSYRAWRARIARKVEPPVS
jgi:hypothetical protein